MGRYLRLGWHALILLALAWSAAAQLRLRAEGDAQEYEIGSEGDGWKWFEMRNSSSFSQRENQQRAAGFSGRCFRDTNEYGNFIYRCSACFDPMGAIFHLGKFAETFGINVDVSKLGGIFTASVPVPHICVDVCEGNPHIGHRREDEEPLPEGPQDEEEADGEEAVEVQRFFDDIGDWVTDGADFVADVADEVIDTFCDLGEICTPSRVSLELALTMLLSGGPTGLIAGNLKKAALKQATGNPDAAVAPFPGAPELFGEVCLTLDIPLCEFDIRAQVTYAGLAILGAAFEDWGPGEIMDSLDALREATCRRRAINNSQQNFQAVTNTGTYRSCRVIDVPMLKGKSVCIELRELVISAQGFQACLAVEIGTRVDLGCLQVGDVDECSQNDCNTCLKNEKCGWCPVTKLCMPRLMSVVNPCNQCPIPVKTENPALICGGLKQNYDQCVSSFRKADIDRDFLVTKEEFLFGPGKWLLEGDITEAYDYLDGDGDGTLQMEEFCLYSAN
ncbi:hypothetical protein QOT17_011135 [Balamuthia mandrillaris]